MHVILLMTTEAVCRQLVLVDIAAMARAAADILVFAGEPEFRVFVVIESGFLPP